MPGCPISSRAEAFVGHRGEGVNYARNLWHAPIAAIGPDGDFLMFMWESGSPEDCILHHLHEPLVVGSIQPSRRIGASMSLDLAFVRSQFPALADGFAYFDNAGGSLVLRNVAERISEYLLTTSVQTGASYEHSQRATSRLTEARAKIARLLGAERPEEIVLGPSTTVLAQFLSRAMESQPQAR